MASPFVGAHAAPSRRLKTLIKASPLSDPSDLGWPLAAPEGANKPMVSVSLTSPCSGCVRRENTDVRGSDCNAGRSIQACFCLIESGAGVTHLPSDIDLISGHRLSASPASASLLNSRKTSGVGQKDRNNPPASSTRSDIFAFPLVIGLKRPQEATRHYRAFEHRETRSRTSLWFAAVKSHPHTGYWRVRVQTCSAVHGQE